MPSKDSYTPPLAVSHSITETRLLPPLLIVDEMERVHHRQTILSGKYFSDTENKGRTSNKRHILHEGRPHRQAHRHILPPIGIYLRTKTYSCEKILPPAAPDKSLSNLVLSLGKRESTISTLSHRRYNRTKRTTRTKVLPRNR